MTCIVGFVDKKNKKRILKKHLQKFVDIKYLRIFVV